ncbi:nuclear transport factor 2 family protein [Actinoallomurus acaciae]|uniref:Nuclear transport factor 2 family protein n=1 Tax=Actinoallomurus acaciae TaxID=502577 RepID=A0ABV5YHK7_9ACTN
MSSSTAATPREVLARLHELTVADEAGAVDLYAEDAVHEIPFAPAGAPARVEGQEALRRLMDAQGGRSPVKYQGFENVQVWDTTDPEVIIAEYEVVGTVVSTGAGFRLSQLLILRVRDGRILLTRSYLDPGRFAELLA